MATAATIPTRVGLALPLVKLNGGYFSSRNEYDTAWGDLIVAAFTPIGGRFMRRDAGGTVSDYLMAPLDGVFMVALRDAIVSAVGTQCPHIRITNVVVNSSNAKTANVAISFTLSTNPIDPQTRLVRLDRRQVGNVLRNAQVM